jgi:hypothetical protein
VKKAITTMAATSYGLSGRRISILGISKRIQVQLKMKKVSILKYITGWRATFTSAIRRLSSEISSNTIITVTKIHSN